MVAFRAGDGLVLHRVERLGRERVQTRGDNSLGPDRAVARTEVVGVLMAVRAPGGAWVRVPRRWAMPGWLGLRAAPIRGKNVLRAVLAAHRFLPLGIWSWLMGAQRFDIQRIGREVMIYDQEKGDLHALNETASRIYQMAADGQTVDSIVAALAEQYPDAEPQDLRADVAATVEQLRSLGVVG